MVMTEDRSPLPMNGGNSTYSYSKNSSYQEQSANFYKDIIDEEIAEKLDVQKLLSASNSFNLADLGCSVGPNTFHAVQRLLEAIKQKCRSQCSTSEMPDFQVFFNDQVLNDFNTFFTSLPLERQYFAAGVPGSFHTRLFPKSSIHFAHMSYALHWLSKVPNELLDKSSPAWNKGRVHYAGAPVEVVNAYASQFAQDIENFLKSRAMEIVTGGMTIIIMPCIPNRMDHSDLTLGQIFTCMASSLMDMVKDGLISEDQVDSFNVPTYAPSPDEMTELVERNGCFSIERMETTNPAAWLKGPINPSENVAHVRAATEGILTQHFHGNIADEMFNRMTEKLMEFSDQMNTLLQDENYKIQLLLVLKRK